MSEVVEKQFKVAKAAREIAAEVRDGTFILNGTGLTFTSDGPCCVFGHVLARAGFAPNDYIVENTEALARFLNVDYDHVAVHRVLDGQMDLIALSNDSADPHRGEEVAEHLEGFADEIEGITIGGYRGES